MNTFPCENVEDTNTDRDLKILQEKRHRHRQIYNTQTQTNI